MSGFSRFAHLFPLLLLALFLDGNLFTFGDIDNRPSVVNVDRGVIVGAQKTSAKGHAYHSFTGIRYGKPPVGKLRFKRPEPVDKLEGTFDATEEVKCWQNEDLDNGMGRVIGQDDCLALSVFTRDIPKGRSDSLKPVMVWIHGGAFQLGSGTTDLYGPGRFMDEDVVIVEINYRVGTLGFLSTGDDVFPGNMGMWDQVLALKWVRDHIAAFGGDPDNVTIFGNSAGGISVSYLLVSPAASGLFHKAIVQSGPPNCNFCKSEKHPAYYARTLAGSFGCDPESTSEEIYACMSRLPSSQLIKPPFPENEFEWLPKIFKPIVDDYAEEPFLPGEPLELIERGEFSNVPLIIGSNRHEGQLFMLSKPKLQDYLLEKWNSYIPTSLLFRETDSHDSSTDKFARMVKEEFFGGRAPDLATGDRATLMELQGDAFANYASTKFARTLAAASSRPVYEYRYGHAASFTLTDVVGGGLLVPLKITAKLFGRALGIDVFPNTRFANHGDEVFLMWTSAIPYDTVYTEGDRTVSAAMIGMWTAFAKHGDPTPEGLDAPGDDWAPVEGGKDSKHLEITGDGLKLKSDSLEYRRRGRFWDKVFEEHPPLLQYRQSPSFQNPLMYSKKIVDESRSCFSWWNPLMYSTKS